MTEVTDAIYFQVERDLKRQFNIALAKNGETKKKILEQAVQDYIKKNGNI